STESTTKPVTPSSTISGMAPSFQTITGVPNAMASITTRPNGSGQSIGKTSAAALPRKAGLSASLISPTYSTSTPSISGSVVVREEGRVVLVDLGGDLQLHAASTSDLDGTVGPLSARQPAEEGEIRRRLALPMAS